MTHNNITTQMTISQVKHITTGHKSSTCWSLTISRRKKNTIKKCFMFYFFTQWKRLHWKVSLSNNPARKETKEAKAHHEMHNYKTTINYANSCEFESVNTYCTKQYYSAGNITFLQSSIESVKLMHFVY